MINAVEMLTKPLASAWDSLVTFDAINLCSYDLFGSTRSGGGYLISTTMGVKISPLFLFPYCVYIGGVGGGGVMEY